MSINGDFGLGIVTWQQFDLDIETGRYDDWPIAQCMRTNGHDDDGVQQWLNDRTAAAQRVRRRSGWRGNDESVACMRIDVSIGDPGLDIDHAAGFPPLQHDIVYGNGQSLAAIRCRDFRLE